VNIADETLPDYSFLSRYHYTKSKNYLKRRYRIRHRIPMFIGTPCTIALNVYRLTYVKKRMEIFIISTETRTNVLFSLIKGTTSVISGDPPLQSGISDSHFSFYSFKGLNGTILKFT